MIEYGTFTGDGAAKNISIGFLPAAVIILNVTDGTNVMLYVKGMTGSIDIDAAAGPLTDAGGITEYTGADAAANGFSVDAGNSVNAKVYRWIAFRAK